MWFWFWCVVSLSSIENVCDVPLVRRLCVYVVLLAICWVSSMFRDMSVFCCPIDSRLYQVSTWDFIVQTNKRLPASHVNDSWNSSYFRIFFCWAFSSVHIIHPAASAPYFFSFLSHWIFIFVKLKSILIQHQQFCFWVSENLLILFLFFWSHISTWHLCKIFQLISLIGVIYIRSM